MTMKMKKTGNVHAFRAAATALFVLLGLLASGGGRLAAKKKPRATKTISGAVLDTSNNGIPGASVMLTDLETHHTDGIYSGPHGTYSFSGLDPNHDYKLQATYKNQVSEVREVSSLDTRMQIVVNLILKHPTAAQNSQ